MGEVGADEDEVAVVVGADVVADEALAAGVEGEGEFEFGVVVPLEGDGVVEASVEAAEGAFGFGGEELSKWLDLAHGVESTPESYRYLPTASNTRGVEAARVLVVARRGR